MTMEYNSVGSITRKTQTSDKTSGPGGNKWIPQKKTTYDFRYTYDPKQPHAATHIGSQTYTYDADGNQTGRTDDLTGQRQNLVWDEENRLRSVAVNGQLNSYVYDAAGERVLKGQGAGQSVFVNGDLKAGSGGLGNFTVYVNPYLVAQSGQYSKHYFIENQRITTRLEQGWQKQVSAPAAGDTIAYSKKEQKLLQGIARDQQAIQGSSQQPVTAVTGPDARGVASSNGQAGGNGNGIGTTGGSAGSANNGNHYAYGHYKGHTDTTNQSFLYFYHPDHLGSTSYVTDDAGEVYEHMEYFAFGETFVQEHSNTDRIPYLFNGKELDEETGLYYYGARYYDPRTSIWQSVDPLADIFAGWAPYNYGLNNPLRFTDPTGLGPGDRVKKAASLEGHKYSQVEGLNTGHELRTGNSPKALEYLDCSEFVCRVMADDGITNGVQQMSTKELVDFFGNKDKFIRSEDEPQSGDIFLWRDGDDGHTGVVVSYDAQSGTVVTSEARGVKYGSLQVQRQLSVFTGHAGWKGFYRPKKENHNNSQQKESGRKESSNDRFKRLMQKAGEALQKSNEEIRKWESLRKEAEKNKQDEVGKEGQK